MIEFIYDFIAQAFNIKGFTGDKVNQPFNRLGRAGESSGAAADGFVFFANRVGAAFRADAGKYKFLRIGGAFVCQNLNNLRYDVTCPLDDHRIADADVFAFDFVFIVQGGMGNDNAADVNRFKVGNRSQSTGASDLNADVVDLCDSLFGRNLWATAQRGVRVKKPRRS